VTPARIPPGPPRPPAAPSVAWAEEGDLLVFFEAVRRVVSGIVSAPGPAVEQPEGEMGANVLGYVAIGWAVVGPPSLGGQPDAAADAERVARLIRQLGDDDFEKRDAASKELDAIGEPAAAALRQAAKSAADPEVRRRAEGVLQAQAGRAAKREFDKLQGAWSLVAYETDGRRVKGEDDGHRFTFTGEKWSLRVGGQVFQAGTVTRVEARGKAHVIELLITEGGNVGGTAVSIFAVEGDSLRYLNTGDPAVTDFATKPGDGRHYLTFRRVRP